jgi:hypothetical protein
MAHKPYTSLRWPCPADGPATVGESRSHYFPAQSKHADARAKRPWGRPLARFASEHGLHTAAATGLALRNLGPKPH